MVTSDWWLVGKQVNYENILPQSFAEFSAESRRGKTAVSECMRIHRIIHWLHVLSSLPSCSSWWSVFLSVLCVLCARNGFKVLHKGVQNEIEWCPKWFGVVPSVPDEGSELLSQSECATPEQFCTIVSRLSKMLFENLKSVVLSRYPKHRSGVSRRSFK